MTKRKINFTHNHHAPSKLVRGLAPIVREGSNHKKLLIILSLIIISVFFFIVKGLGGQLQTNHTKNNLNLSLSSSLTERAQTTSQARLKGQVLVKNLYVVDGNSAGGSLGLSGISDLQNSGMLFFYPQAKTVNFWMKDMKIPLDIIWLGCDGQILGWQVDAKPSDYPKTYKSPKLNYVLEVESGFIDRHQLKAGDKLELELSDSGFECKN
jgi:uncharacterized membrane protein (UPF0127 family)